MRKAGRTLKLLTNPKNASGELQQSPALTYLLPTRKKICKTTDPP